MQIKNLQYNSFGTIDCEIEHPAFGWIPFTASPDDTEEKGKEIYQRAISGEFGEIAPYVEPPTPPVVVPTVVSMRQARRALLQQNLLSAVQPAIDSLPSPEKEAAHIDWEYAQEVKRSDPLVQSLAVALELTEEDLDNLFLLASTF